MEPEKTLKENDRLVRAEEIKKNKLHSKEIASNNSNNLINNVAEEKKTSTLFWLLPSISTFVGISTLLKSNLVWLCLTLGFSIAVVNAYALYRHDKNKTCWTRGLLVVLEIVGIVCLCYDAIEVFHKNVPASLPQPFNQCNNKVKMCFGIGLLIVVVFFSIILVYLENCQSTSESNYQNNFSGINHSNKNIYLQMFFTGGIVFMGTYPLMIDFFTGLNHSIYTSWIMVLAIGFTLCSSAAQAFLITVAEDKDNPDPVKKKRNVIIEWFGKFFMSLEIILSLANTAFSNNDSAVDECLDLFNNNWVEKNAHFIGLNLFIIAIAVFIGVTYQHFKKYPKNQPISCIAVLYK